MKKVFSKGVSLIMAAMMCLALLPMSALAADSDFIIENGVLKSYVGLGVDVVIPNGVTEIYAMAFQDREVTSITIPDSVTSIGQNAFIYCDAKSITIGKNVKSIGAGAFTDCWNLTSITIPDSVTDLGNNAFSNCKSLTTAKLGNGVTSIGEDAFWNCASLTGVTIGNGVKSIGERAFWGCTSLTTIDIPNSVTSIDERAFEGCTALTSATIGNGVTSIGPQAFKDCSNLTNISIPDSVTSIGMGAFSGCKSPTSLTIPDSVTSIGDIAFGDCTGLENVIIGSGITKIDGNVFGGCTSLKSVTIPDSVTSISDGAFSGCGEFTVYGSEGSYAQKWVEDTNAKTYMRNVGMLTFVSTGGTSKPTEPTTPTTTEKPSAWAESQVTAAISNNLVPQDLQAKYTQAATRAEFAALAVTLYEQVTGKTITERVTFSDTQDVNVQKAAGIGVVNGVGDNKFDPSAGLTREQAATMLSRLAAVTGKPLTGQTATFADNASVSTWALEAVGQMQTSGIMGGIGNNSFDPKGAYTREQSIITIQRLYDTLIGTTGGTDNPPSSGNVLNGTYQWAGYDGGNSADMVWVYVFKSDGTVTHSQDYAGGENLYSASGTYTISGDKVTTTTGHDYFGITYNATNDTITLSGIFGDRVFEKVN